MIDDHLPDLQNRVALVTGANHGIGAATARVLAARGVSVILTYLRLETPPDACLPGEYATARGSSADHVVERIEAAGGRAVAMEADLADPASPGELFDAAERALGPVEILVNNASGWVADTFKPTSGGERGPNARAVSVETVERQLAVDVRGSALLISEFARRHAERGASWGRIVGLTSGGPLGFPGEVSYGAAKAALESYTMSAALELAALGVTANVVYPPVTDTGWVTDEVRRFVDDSREHFHVARPEEVAEVVAWLASDEARLVTANVIRMR
ncbi:MAG: SDR family oxidoreductase [Solirubrobacteraceae bacterium]